MSVWLKWRDYRKIREEISRYEGKPTEEVCGIVAALAREYPELQKTEIVYFPFISSPVLMGIRKPKIVLPEKEFTERELKYILAHEVMHVRNYDTFWKLLVDILCTVYWWNPAFYLLKNEAFEIIEIKNDLRLTKNMSNREKEEYLEALRSVAALSAAPNYVGAVGFSYKPVDELKRRFDMVINGASGNRAAGWTACLLVLAISFASSCVIFEPKFGIPEDVVEVTESNTYILEEDGVYKVYVDGEYWFDADSLEYLPEEIIEN